MHTYAILFRFDRQRNFPESIKVNILQKYRLAELKYWRFSYKTNPYNISVTFSEFIRYIVESNIPELNEHFQPMMDICHPCLIKYSFYGNFRNISHDVSALIKKFGTNPRFYQKPKSQCNSLLNRNISSHNCILFLNDWSLQT